MNDNQLNEILLKPRFKSESTDNKVVIVGFFEG